MSRELSIRAAQGVIAAAMRQGDGTPAAIAAAEDAAGILFDPEQAEAIAKAAREQAEAEFRARVLELEDQLRAARETVEAEQGEVQRLRALVPPPRRASTVPAPADDEDGLSGERLAACRALLKREAATERDFGYTPPLLAVARDLLREVDRRGALLAELDEATADVLAPVTLLAKASLVGAEGGARRG